MLGYIAFFSEKKLTVDFSLEQMFPKNDPQREVYEQFLSEFSREDDLILLTYSGGDPLTRQSVENIANLTEDLEFVDGVESVLSLSNLMDGEFFNADLLDVEWQMRREDIVKHPIFTNVVISESGSVGALLVNLDDSIRSQESRALIFLEIDELLSNTKWEWHEAGIPVLRTRYIELVAQERAIFFPLSFLVVVLILYAVFRQVKGILLPIAGITVALVWVAGIMALLGITVNVVSYLTFNLLMIIGCSNAIHLLIKYHESLGLGFGRKDALDRVITEIGGALFLTSFTTAIGFFSLMMTNIRITQEFGFIVGVGVVIMFMLTIIILPILLSFIALPDKIHIQRLIKGEEFKAAYKLNEWTKGHPYMVIVLTVIVFCTSLVGLYKIDYNISILDDLKPGNELFDDVRFVEENLGGTLPLEIAVDTGVENGITNPTFLSILDNFKKDILSIQGIGAAITIADHLKLINEAIGNGKRELPDNKDEVLSFLVSYEETSGLANADYSKARISARVVNITSEQAKGIVTQINSFAKKRFTEETKLTITGSTLLALRTNAHLVKNLTTSFVIAFFIIFLSMVFLFRSLRLSLLSILPNIIPLMVAGGLMGFLGIKLRPSTAMTFSIALGIAVDDTIHFLARFRQEYLKGLSIPDAVSQTLLTTGKAIISTTIILSLGFVVMVFSEFVPNHEFGMLATIILVVALTGSLVLLPVLINFIQPQFRFSVDKK